MVLFKAHIRRHLAQEARGCTYLILWLDCDREGENICYEGIVSCSGITVHAIVSSCILEIWVVYRELYVEFVFVRSGPCENRKQ